MVWWVSLMIRGVYLWVKGLIRSLMGTLLRSWHEFSNDPAVTECKRRPGATGEKLFWVILFVSLPSSFLSLPLSLSLRLSLSLSLSLRKHLCLPRVYVCKHPLQSAHV